MKATGSPASPASRLIFRWPERSASFLLPLLFLLAVAVHGLTFYIFQIVYPPTVSIAPPPAQITLLAPSSPENEALLKWVEAQSPAAAPRLQALTPPGLGQVGYVPSYAAVHTLPKPAVARPGGTAFPPAYLPARPENSLPPPVPARPAVASAFTLSPELRDRGGAPVQPLPVPSPAAHPPTVFLIGLSDRGELRYTFLQSGSGDPDLDRRAEEWLRAHEFRRAEGAAPLAWGLATFAWGASSPSPVSP